MSKGSDKPKSEVLQGRLDLMILKTLHVLEPLHGFVLARRIEQVSEDVLRLNEGAVYTSLLRLPGALVVRRALGSLLFGIALSDVTTYAAAIAVVCLAGFVAC